MGDRGSSSGFVGSNQERKREKSIQSTLKSIVEKRRTAKIEFGYTVDLDGNIINMNRGGKSSCKITDCWDRIGIHNHPDGEQGQIGGTFSAADLRSMLLTNRPINYAFDRETIYELRALNWSPKGEWNFGNSTKAIEIHNKYNKYVNDSCLKAYNTAKQMLQTGKFDRKDGTVDTKAYADYQAREWHRMLGDWLRNNAKDFGYEYSEHKIR